MRHAKFGRRSLAGLCLGTPPPSFMVLRFWLPAQAGFFDEDFDDSDRRLGPADHMAHARRDHRMWLRHRDAELWSALGYRPVPDAAFYGKRLGPRGVFGRACGSEPALGP